MSETPSVGIADPEAVQQQDTELANGLEQHAKKEKINATVAVGKNVYLDRLKGTNNLVDHDGAFRHDYMLLSLLELSKNDPRFTKEVEEISSKLTKELVGDQQNSDGDLENLLLTQLAGDALDDTDEENVQDIDHNAREADRFIDATTALTLKNSQQEGLNKETLIANGAKMIDDLIYESTDPDFIYAHRSKRIPKIIQQAAVLSVLSDRYPEIREQITEQAERIADYANRMLDQNELKLALPALIVLNSFKNPPKSRYN